jgi:hypothetical protein
MMKYLPTLATAAFIALSNVSASLAIAPEYKACHAGAGWRGEPGAFRASQPRLAPLKNLAITAGPLP